MGAPEFSVRPIASNAEWAEAVRLRTQVFIVEQACPPEEEWDAFDPWDVPGVRHVLGWTGGQAVATARWRVVAHAGRPAAKLERFAVDRAHRGAGLGRALVRALVAQAEAAGYAHQVLHAQAHLEGFYASFGFVRCGPPFEEAGIAHVPMARG